MVINSAAGQKQRGAKAMKKDESHRQAYTIRLRTDLLRQMKQLAVNEDKRLEELMEEAIVLVLQQRCERGI
ncbi:MAG: hypothetical protein ABSC19_02735 [Syntrophorhabdales bacterium]|jgi:hypothetical protein